MSRDSAPLGADALSAQPAKAGSGELAHHIPEYRRLIESLRVMLAIIAGLLMLDTQPTVQGVLSLGVLAFSAYAIILLWQAANGSTLVQGRIFYWLDACWFLLLIALADEARTHFFLFLFFPVFFAAWRTGYRESIAIAAFSGLASLVIFALSDPAISLTRLLALPLSLFVVGPLFVALARVEAATQKSQAFAATILEAIELRRSFDSIVPDLLAQIAGHVGASAAILALRTHEGRSRVFCWEAKEGSSELSESAAYPVTEQALSLAARDAFGWENARPQVEARPPVRHWAIGHGAHPHASRSRHAAGPGRHDRQGAPDFNTALQPEHRPFAADPGRRPH